MQRNEIITSIQSSLPTLSCIEGNVSWRLAAISSNVDLHKLFFFFFFFCIIHFFGPSNCNIFFTSGHHIFKPFSVTS
ncbi:hypothetical protein E2C01_066740 [Portunus trituberculatus]|uniref:Uncharacterized protein n=1 Tax=Portunus trituberculatus TaxID=210409 RepID=A0A5B7HRS9_PORTR|nr:hypothetical protein [Portunus trituberculatus]